MYYHIWQNIKYRKNIFRFLPDSTDVLNVNYGEHVTITTKQKICTLMI